MNIESMTEEQVLARLLERSYLFVGAISFEERCTHICTLLAERRILPCRAEVVDYPTVATPPDLDKILRHQHADMFTRSFGDSTRKVTLNAYSASLLRRHSLEIVSATESTIVVDITCMTRAHLMSLASVMVSRARPEQEIYFSYTAAEYYSIEKEVTAGWRDVLLVPVGNPRSLRREGHARGIVLTGHDAERLSLALNELEPGAGSIVFADTPERPDFMRHAQQVNDSITKNLLSLRMPRTEIAFCTDDKNKWKQTCLGLTDYPGLGRVIEKEVKYASADEGPVILFPFGPKNLTLAASVLLASATKVNVWAVYPVPFQYDVDYSQSNARVHWMRMPTRT